MKKFSHGAAFAALLLLLLAPRLALAHAVLVSSTPAVHGTAHGPDVAIHLKFNSRVDGERSHLSLASADGHDQALASDKQDAPDSLTAHARLKPGSYMLHWQALSTDGHVTRGEIPFNVQ
jgi:methionine-rich copper-binding protein CopC